jgi:hypothetical protein
MSNSLNARNDDDDYDDDDDNNNNNKFLDSRFAHCTHEDY